MKILSLAKSFRTFSLALCLLAGAFTEARAFGSHGVSIHNWMNWADVDASKADYVWPPYNSPEHALSDAELSNISASGFDFVRLTLDPGPFLRFTGEKRDALDRLLLANVKRILAAGPDVIVDFHPNEQVRAYMPVKLVKNPKDPVFVAYLAMVKRTAGVLASLPQGRVALEPMNEPATGYGRTGPQWQEMMKEFYDAIRASAPHLVVVATGSQGGGMEGLFALDPRPMLDANALFSFHYYLPMEFTHQNVPLDGELSSNKYFSGLPYPPDPDAFDTLWPQVAGRIRADETLSGANRARAMLKAKTALSAYLSDTSAAGKIDKDFDLVLQWAKVNGIDPHHILLGEFGVERTYGRYHGATDADRARWLSTVRKAAEARGFKWSIWAHKGYGGMAITTDDESAEIDPVTLQALGLRK